MIGWKKKYKKIEERKLRMKKNFFDRHDFMPKSSMGRVKCVIY